MSDNIDTRPCVYILTAGMYSDKRILGIFSTLERAKAVKDRLDTPSKDESVFKCYDTNDIEEYTLDEFSVLGNSEYWFWYVDMDKDGTVHSVGKEAEDCVFPYALSFYGSKSHYAKGLVFLVCARDQEHAIKIVNERRAILIANNLWKEDENGQP